MKQILTMKKLSKTYLTKHEMFGGMMLWNLLLTMVSKKWIEKRCIIFKKLQVSKDFAIKDKKFQILT